MNENNQTEPKTRHQVLLDRETLKLARELGDGNLSAGLREAVRLLQKASLKGAEPLTRPFG